MDSTTAVPTAPPRRNTDSSADSLSEHEDVSSLASGWSEDDQSESQGDGQPREDSTTPTPVVPVLTSLLAVSTPAQDVETLRITNKTEFIYLSLVMHLSNSPRPAVAIPVLLYLLGIRDRLLAQCCLALSRVDRHTLSSVHSLGRRPPPA